MANAFRLIYDDSSYLLPHNKCYSLPALKGMALLYLVLTKQPYGCTILQMMKKDSNGLDYPLILNMMQENVVKRNRPTSPCSNVYLCTRTLKHDTCNHNKI